MRLSDSFWCWFCNEALRILCSGIGLLSLWCMMPCTASSVWDGGFNPFTAMLSFLKMTNKSAKFVTLQPFCFLLFLHWHVKGFWSKCMALKVDVTGPEKVPFAGASVHLSAQKFYRLVNFVQSFVIPSVIVIHSSEFSSILASFCGLRLLFLGYHDLYCRSRARAICRSVSYVGRHPWSAFCWAPPFGCHLLVSLLGKVCFVKPFWGQSVPTGH